MAQSVNVDLDFTSGARIKSLLPAVAAGQPIVYEQLNSALEGLAWKDSARVSTQGNINLSAPGATIDGITMALNDRFLAPFQTTTTQNGIYVWNGAASPASRSFDAQTGDDLEGAVVTIEEGTSAGQTYRQTQVNFTIGTGSPAFVQFGTTVGAASTTSAGIVRLGTAAEVAAGTDNTIAITPAGLASYTGFSKKYTTLIGDGSAASFTVSHNFNTRDVAVQVYRNVSPWDQIIVDMQRTTVNAVTINFSGTVPTSNQYRVVVIG